MAASPEVFARLERRIDPALLLETMSSAVFTLDEDLRFCSANPATEQLFSTSWHSLRQSTIDDLLGPHTVFASLVRQVLQSGSSVSDFGIEIASRRGTRVEVDSHVSPIPNFPRQVLVVLHPCSVARALDSQDGSTRGSRSVAALAATLAHEVKNPLSGIRGAAQLLETYVDGEDRSLIRLICEETDRICGLLDGMDQFSEPPAIHAEPINIHVVLEHVRKLAEFGFARHVKFAEFYDPSLPYVYGDRDKLIQVFLNLVKNAAEATPFEGARITLTTHFRHGLRRNPAHQRGAAELPIVVDVQDNGPGIPDELADNLFDPFISSKLHGRGLGLPLVAKIIGDHGGLVSCEPSTAGAHFRVRLSPAPAKR